MNDPKSGEDIELEQWANAMLAEDAQSRDQKMPDYRREFGMIQRAPGGYEEMPYEPETIARMLDKGEGKLVP